MKTIVVDGIIGWDVDLRTINRKLASANGEDVVVEMSSPGGSISEGLKIFNAFKNYAGKLTFLITGMAASMGSYIMLARGKENVTVEKNAVVMIHNASNIAWGDYRTMGHMASLLDNLTGHLANVYVENTGKPMEEIRALLDDETYIYGEDIVAQGFATAMVDSGDQDNLDEPGAVALAKLAIGECMTKVKESEMSDDDIQNLSATVMQMAGPKNPPEKADNNEPHTQEETSMDMKELKGKYPELCAALKAEGVAIERERVKSIVAFRGKFPKLHATIDSAVSEGHDLMTLNLNIMAAQSASDEVDAAGNEGADGNAGGNHDAGGAPMTGGEMTTQEHLDANSADLANLVGLAPVKEG